MCVESTTNGTVKSWKYSVAIFDCEELEEKSSVFEVRSIITKESSVESGPGNG